MHVSSLFNSDVMMSLAEIAVGATAIVYRREFVKHHREFQKDFFHYYYSDADMRASAWTVLFIGILVMILGAASLFQSIS
jgi:hypothetical protein